MHTRNACEIKPVCVFAPRPQTRCQRSVGRRRRRRMPGVLAHNFGTLAHRERAAFAQKLPSI